eukprot:GHVL01033842.1.p1 GENE.GHVL01033842.1~~GHVL01033842.1.p1  ORF type:complete len:880 (+),score=171.64 GHVL01033842.1:1721-4360(+)
MADSLWSLIAGKTNSTAEINKNKDAIKYEVIKSVTYGLQEIGIESSRDIASLVENYKYIITPKNMPGTATISSEVGNKNYLSTSVKGLVSTINPYNKRKIDNKLALEREAVKVIENPGNTLDSINNAATIMSKDIIATLQAEYICKQIANSVQIPGETNNNSIKFPKWLKTQSYLTSDQFILNEKGSSPNREDLLVDFIKKRIEEGNLIDTEEFINKFFSQKSIEDSVNAVGKYDRSYSKNLSIITLNITACCIMDEMIYNIDKNNIEEITGKIDNNSKNFTDIIMRLKSNPLSAMTVNKDRGRVEREIYNSLLKGFKYSKEDNLIRYLQSMKPEEMQNIQSNALESCAKQDEFKKLLNLIHDENNQQDLLSKLKKFDKVSELNSFPEECNDISDKDITKDFLNKIKKFKERYPSGKDYFEDEQDNVLNELKGIIESLKLNNKPVDHLAEFLKLTEIAEKLPQDKGVNNLSKAIGKFNKYFNFSKNCQKMTESVKNLKPEISKKLMQSLNNFSEQYPSSETYKRETKVEIINKFNEIINKHLEEQNLLDQLARFLELVKKSPEVEGVNGLLDAIDGLQAIDGLREDLNFSKKERADVENLNFNTEIKEKLMESLKIFSENHPPKLYRNKEDRDEVINNFKNIVNDHLNLQKKLDNSDSTNLQSPKVITNIYQKQTGNIDNIATTALHVVSDENLLPLIRENLLKNKHPVDKIKTDPSNRESFVFGSPDGVKKDWITQKVVSNNPISRNYDIHIEGTDDQKSTKLSIILKTAFDKIIPEQTDRLKEIINDSRDINDFRETIAKEFSFILQGDIHLSAPHLLKSLRTLYSGDEATLDKDRLKSSEIGSDSDLGDSLNSSIQGTDNYLEEKSENQMSSNRMR